MGRASLLTPEWTLKNTVGSAHSGLFRLHLKLCLDGDVVDCQKVLLVLSRESCLILDWVSGNGESEFSESSKSLGKTVLQTMRIFS